MNLGPNQQQWVAALRSGKYKQGQGRLQSRDSYCCLGVACAVAENNNILVKYEGGQFLGVILDYQQDVIDWLNLENESARFSDDNNVRNSLWKLNDCEQLNFNAIADFIEKNAGLLFKGPK
jgi:hypothetical protein